MTLVELFLRATAALVLGDPAVMAFPVLAVAALGLAAVAVAVMVAQLLALALGLEPASSGSTSRAPADLVTRIAWSHPDADGHARPRAPGDVAPA